MSDVVSQPRAGSVRTNGLDFAYDVRGEGEPIVLLPGVTMRRLMWPDALCDALARQGFQVVRLDNRDAGDSSRIDAPPPNVIATLLRSSVGLSVQVPYRLEDMASDVFGVMGELGHERFHVAGASMGGMIAQTMAITQPTRLRTMVSVMSSPGGRRNSIGTPAALKALLSPPPADREQHIAKMMASFRLLHGEELPFDEEDTRALILAQLDGGTSPAAAARQFGAIFEGLLKRKTQLPQVQTPTLVVHGSVDPLLPMRGAKAMTRMMTRAELKVIKGMGHNFPWGAELLQIADAITEHARKHG